MKDSVGLRALQQNAAAVIARAARGEVVEVTDRGRPVARIVPLTESPLADLVVAGHARPARRRVSDLPSPLPPRRSSQSLGRLLAIARADER